MSKMTIENLKPGDEISLTEYRRRPLSGRLIVTRQIERATVVKVLEKGQVMPLDELREWAGEDIEGNLAVYLSQADTARLFLRDRNGSPLIADLCDEFLKNGTQIIELAGREEKGPVPPSYLDFLDTFTP